MSPDYNPLVLRDAIDVLAAEKKARAAGSISKMPARPVNEADIKRHPDPQVRRANVLLKREIRRGI